MRRRRLLQTIAAGTGAGTGTLTMTQDVEAQANGYILLSSDKDEDEYGLLEVYVDESDVVFTDEGEPRLWSDEPFSIRILFSAVESAAFSYSASVVLREFNPETDESERLDEVQSPTFAQTGSAFQEFSVNLTVPRQHDELRLDVYTHRESGDAPSKGTDAGWSSGGTVADDIFVEKTGDYDSDGLTNQREINYYSTDPTVPSITPTPEPADPDRATPTDEPTRPPPTTAGASVGETQSDSGGAQAPPQNVQGFAGQLFASLIGTELLVAVGTAVVVVLLVVTWSREVED